MSGIDDFLWPLPALENGVRPVISDGFKAEALPGVHRQHLGVDLMYPRDPHGDAKPPQFTKGFACITGTQVLAAGPGIINTVDLGDPHGVFVLIDHGVLSGIDGARSTGYRHLATCSVQKGDQVGAGQVIGTAGHDLAAGASSPNHLHFELWDRSRPRIDGLGPRAAFSIDPADDMSIWRVKTSSGFTSPDDSPAGDEDAGEVSNLQASRGQQAGLGWDLAHGVVKV